MNLSKCLFWYELFAPESVQHIMQNLKYFKIETVEIDQVFQKTTLYGEKNYSSNNRTSQIFDIVPDQIIFDTSKEALCYITKKQFNLIDFPRVLNFIEKNCDYIYEYIMEKNIDTLMIQGNFQIDYYDNYSSINKKFEEYGLTKSWIMHLENLDNLSPIILASIASSFYQQNQNIIFDISSYKDFSKIIDSENIRFINSLLYENIDILKGYMINENIDNCIHHFDKFEFLQNLIFESKHINMYTQNLDIKFLSYISQSNIKQLIFKYIEENGSWEFNNNFQMEKQIDEKYNTNILL